MHLCAWSLTKIQSSGQHIEYFETLQCKCGFEIPLKILLQSNVHWGTADRMLGQAYHLHQVYANVIILD